MGQDSFRQLCGGPGCSGAGGDIFKGNTTGLQSQPGSPKQPERVSQNILTYTSLIRPQSCSALSLGRSMGDCALGFGSNLP